MPQAPELSLIVPVYNEQDNLPLLAEEIRRALEPLALDYEVLLVDDGSTDAGPVVMRRLAAADRRLRVLRLSRNSGLSAALDAGFRHARAPTLVTLDSDLQNDPADIPRLLDKLEEARLVFVDAARNIDGKRQFQVDGEVFPGRGVHRHHRSRHEHCRRRFPRAPTRWPPRPP